MGNTLSKLYHMLPGPARSLAVSVHGYRLRARRYGADAEALVEAALERDTWSRETWRNWQEEQLGRMLRHAATSVPYYREMWSRRRLAGDRRSWEYLENWPVLDKEPLRQTPEAFLADGSNRDRLHAETTSGTTGQPITLFFSAETERAWYALCEARWRRWNSLFRGENYASVGAQLVTPLNQTSPPFWAWNRAFRQLYMSAYHVRPETMASYLDAIEEYRIQYLWGHASVMTALARAVLDSGRTGMAMRVVLTASEPVSAGNRLLISKAFQCPVRETYGMAENVAGASECQSGHLHLWPDAGRTELLAAGKPVPDGQVGEFVFTGFLNWDMPLIRYRPGDLGTMKILKDLCPCGRDLPVLAGIDGRTSDLLHTKGGRTISPSAAEMVFDADLPLREAQLIQDELDRFRVVFVPGEGYSEATERLLMHRIRERIGEVGVTFHSVDSIERGPSGKFRAVVSRLNSDNGSTRKSG